MEVTSIRGNLALMEVNVMLVWYHFCSRIWLCKKIKSLKENAIFFEILGTKKFFRKWSHFLRKFNLKCTNIQWRFHRSINSSSNIKIGVLLDLGGLRDIKVGVIISLGIFRSLEDRSISKQSAPHFCIQSFTKLASLSKFKLIYLRFTTIASNEIRTLIDSDTEEDVETNFLFGLFIFWGFCQTDNILLLRV